MALDGITLYKVKEDLNKYLPIRINRIAETSKTEIVFNVHANGIRTNLVMSFHSNYNHICLSDRNYTTYNDPSTFVMVLRKHILNGIIDKIEQFNYDRYLLLHIRARDELYDEKKYILSVELMGKYANLILVDENNKIIDALKKIPPFENTKRTIIGSAQFTLPDKQDKLDPFNTDQIDFDESLVKQLQGFSKLLEDELRFRMDRNEKYEDIMKLIKESDSLYLYKKDDTYLFHVIPLTHLGLKESRYDIQKGFDEAYYRDDEVERIKNISDDLFKIVRRQIKHYKTKVAKLEKSLEDSKNLLEDKENGDLLYMLTNLEQKGLTEIEVNDFSDNKKIIKLDPKLSIKANANKYYSYYQKKRKGKIYIDEQLELANIELEYFESLNEQLSLSNYSDALDIKEELSRHGYLKQSSKNKKKKKINLYQIKVDDKIITFGKNNLQNSFLSFEYAKSNYMWFHAKDYHGSHVVVNTDKPDEKIIRICANIAAYYSKGRYSSSVPVDYCLVKELKKVKGKKPGFVTIRNYKTIYIDPFEDPELKIELI